MTSNASHDVFIAHNDTDSSLAQYLKEKLTADGLNASCGCPPSQHFGTQQIVFAETLQSATTLILLITSHTSTSLWALLDARALHFNESTDATRHFIPVLIEDCAVSPTLAHYSFVNWHTRDESGYQLIRDACTRNSASRTLRHTAPTYLSPTRHYPIENPRALALSRDGTILACAHGYKTARIVDTRSHEDLPGFRLPGHQHFVSAVHLLTGQEAALTGSYDGTLRVWDLRSHKCKSSLKITPTQQPIVAISLSACGNIAAIRTQEVKSHAFLTGDYRGYEDDLSEYPPDEEPPRDEDELSDALTKVHADGTSITVLRLNDQSLCGLIDLPPNRGRTLALSPDASLVAFALDHNLIQVRSSDGSQIISEIHGHTDTITGLCFTSENTRLVSSSSDMTLRVWDIPSGKCLTVLEGHTSPIVNIISCNADGALYSCDQEGGIRAWDRATLMPLNSFYVRHRDISPVTSFAISADGTTAALGTMHSGLSIVSIPALQPVSDDTTYSNAKVLLVGDSGVGKTGLSLRLAEGKFEATISSDAHWATKMHLGTFATRSPLNADTGLPAQPEIQGREIWLWDFAGQSDYRLIHQLFMDETSLAVLVFNPQSDHSLESIGQWMRDLTKACRGSFNTVLVAGRIDRGRIICDRKAVQEVMDRHKMSAYIETSALTGSGCDELRQAIVAGIDWTRIPWTVSPRIFRVLKNEILRLRDADVVLIKLSTLQQQLEMRLPQEQFEFHDTVAVVGLLAGPGLVVRLEFGDIVVLQPEWINRYASAVVRSIRSDLGGIGAIDEARVLAGDLDFTTDVVQKSNGVSVAEVVRLTPSDEVVVLRAMHHMFVNHGLCVRIEVDGGGRQLIFPSYFSNECPSEHEYPPVLVSYSYVGNSAEIYSTLVVTLCHTKVFERDRLWRNAAEFKSQAGKRIGLKMSRDESGATTLNVYSEPDVQDDTKVTFIKYIHEHLLQNASDVVRLRWYVCPHCKHLVRDSELARNILRDYGEKAEIRCQQRVCDKWIPLWDIIEQKFASDEMQYVVERMRSAAQSAIDNQSLELILEGHARVITGEANQIYRGYTGADHGIDGEIEFRDEKGDASGQRLYLQLKNGDSYLRRRNSSGTEVFAIRKARWAKYWMAQKYPVMLVIRSSNGDIRWMDVTEHLKMKHKEHKVNSKAGEKWAPKEIEFNGEMFSAAAIRKQRERIVGFM